MAQNAANIFMEPVQVFYGEDRALSFTVSTVADVSSSLNDKYFFLYDEDAATKYYVWLNVGAAGTDPAVSGATGIEVTLSANATAAAVATAVASAIDGEADFGATASGSIVTVTNAANGVGRAPHDGPDASKTGFELTIQQYGGSERELGLTEGDVTLTPNQNLVDVTSHQLGNTVVASFVNGVSPEVSFTLQETSTTQIQDLYKFAGGDSSSGNSNNGTEVVGYGSANLFQNAVNLAQQLRLHPDRLPSGDRSRDFTFWKAFLQIGDSAFSGENPFTVPVTAKIYPDLTGKKEAVNYYVIGDGTQDLD